MKANLTKIYFLNINRKKFVVDSRFHKASYIFELSRRMEPAAQLSFYNIKSSFPMTQNFSPAISAPMRLAVDPEAVKALGHIIPGFQHLVVLDHFGSVTMLSEVLRMLRPGPILIQCGDQIKVTAFALAIRLNPPNAEMRTTDCNF